MFCGEGHGTSYQCPMQTFIHTEAAEAWVCKAKLQLEELLDTTVFGDTHKSWYASVKQANKWKRVESAMVKPHLPNRLLSIKDVAKKVKLSQSQRNKKAKL